jgi:hypothetical protein
MAFPSGSPQSLRRLFNYMSKRSAAHGGGAKVAIALTAGANNVMGVTITVQDEDGATVAGVHQLDVWASELATGLNLTGDTYSGNLVATAGYILAEPTSKKRWTVLTAATGIFAANLTDTAEPQDQYIAVKNPFGSGITVSAISAGKFG